jgi:hypothetical protein
MGKKQMVFLSKEADILISGVRGQVFYFSSLVTQVTSDLLRVNIYLAPSIVYQHLESQGVAAAHTG